MKPSRTGHAFAYWFIVLVYWLLAICTPFYGWVPLFLLSAYVFRLYERKAAQARKSVGGERAKLTALQEFLSSPEKGLGLWLGSMSTYLVFLFSSASAVYGGEDGGPQRTIAEGGRVPLSNPLGIGGLTAAREDPALFWLCSAFLVLCLLLWMQLVWLQPDPGMLDTRYKDFEEVMAHSLSAQGPPPPHLFCRTTLVKKPLR